MTPSNIIGTVLIAFGVVPFVLWVLDYIDVIRPEADPAHWVLIVFAVTVVGLGVMLRAGKGEKVSEAFLSWFNRGDHSHD